MTNQSDLIIRSVNFRNNYVKELLLSKKMTVQEFVSWYFSNLGIDPKTPICKQDFNKNLYTLNLTKKTLQLKCPKCGLGNIGLKIFKLENEDNSKDVFRVGLTRCSQLECDFVSDESLQPLINKLSTVDLSMVNCAAKQSSRINESQVIIDDSMLYNLKKNELISLIKKTNKKSLFVMAKIIEKPATLIYAGVFLVLFSFGIGFVFKGSSMFASITKKGITITQNQQIQVQTDLSGNRFIQFQNEKYINEKDSKGIDAE